MSVKISALILKNDEENVDARRLPRAELITTMEQRVISDTQSGLAAFSQIVQFFRARLIQIIPLNTPLKFYSRV